MEMLRPFWAVHAILIPLFIFFGLFYFICSVFLLLLLFFLAKSCTGLTEVETSKLSFKMYLQFE